MQPPPGRRRTVLREIGVASVVMALFQSHFGSLKKTLAPLPGSIVMADFEVANSSKETAPAWGWGKAEAALAWNAGFGENRHKCNSGTQATFRQWRDLKKGWPFRPLPEDQPEQLLSERFDDVPTSPRALPTSTKRSPPRNARVRTVASDLELYLPAIDERLTQTSRPMQS